MSCRGKITCKIIYKYITVPGVFDFFLDWFLECYFSFTNKMVKLTQDLIILSPQFTNALKEREIDLRGNKLSTI